MRNRDVGGFLRIEFGGYLLLLEFKCDADCTLPGLHLYGLAALVCRKECHVIENSVLLRVNLLVAGILVESAHIGIVVVVTRSRHDLLDREGRIGGDCSSLL